MNRRPLRIAPQEPHEWNDATRAELAAVVATGGSTRPVHLPGVIATAEGDQGARAYLAAHPHELVECGDLATGHDVDSR